MTTDIALPVKQQLEAYNARDIEAFMPWWADGCRIYAFPDQLLAEGTAAIRARHVERFREPNLYGRLVSRTVIGAVVVDREVVTRDFADGPGEVDVLAIYEIEQGMIARAWFKMGEPRLDASGEPSLRRATVADAEAIQALTRAAYAKWVSVIGREPRPMIADYAEAVRLHRIDLLSSGGELVGLIELVPGEASLLIRNVAVAPDHQGRGFGRQLLDHAERIAAEMLLPLTTLYTNAKFAGNLRLYIGHGYTIERTGQSELGTTVHMSKAVTPMAPNGSEGSR